jgi:AraC-like DNA-binding protein
MLYILSGEGFFETGATRIPLRTGTLVYYPAGTPYHICSHGELLFYTINFDFTLRYAGQYPIPFSPERGERCRQEPLTEGIPPCLSSFLWIREARFAEPHLRRMYEESMRPLAHTAAAMSACLALLLVDLLREIDAPTDHPLSKRIRALVVEDPRRNNQAIARILGYHPYYLNEVFVREEGISLHQFIMRERAARARELITASGRSFTEIAELCGFSSPSHLSRAIRTEYGVTPSMMRKTQ